MVSAPFCSGKASPAFSLSFKAFAFLTIGHRHLNRVCALKKKILFSLYKGNVGYRRLHICPHTHKRRRREKGKRLRLISSKHFLCLQAGSSAALWSTHNIQFTLCRHLAGSMHIWVSSHNCTDAILSMAPAASLFYSAARLM